MVINLDIEEIRFITSAIRREIIILAENERKAFKKKRQAEVETLKDYIKIYRDIENKLEKIYRKWCNENDEIPF